MIIQSRRKFITGLGALFVAAPAIVRASSLMPVKAIEEATPFAFSAFYSMFSVSPSAINFCVMSREDYLRLSDDFAMPPPGGTTILGSGHA